MITNSNVKKKLGEIAYAYNHADQANGIGLINGEMGLCINLSHIAKFTLNDDLKAKADQLLDRLYTNINLSLPINFSDGLTGIAWGIQHIVLNSFATGDINAILKDIDVLQTEVTKYFPAREYSFLTGFIGQIIYIISRLKKGSCQEEMLTLQLRIALISQIERLSYVVKHESVLYSTPLKSDVYWDLPIIAQILECLRNMGIFKSCVAETATIFHQKIIDLRPNDYFHKLMHQYMLLSLSDIGFPILEQYHYPLVHPLPESLLSRYIYEIQLHYRLSKLKPEFKSSYLEQKKKFVTQFELWSPELFFSSMTDGYRGFYRILELLKDGY